MKVGDMVTLANHVSRISPSGIIPSIGIVIALCDAGRDLRVEVLWQTGDLMKMRASLFEVMISE
jgi:hypothetical protein